MPYYPSELKTLSLGVGLNPTIPQVFLYSTDNLHLQIINQTLYYALLVLDIDWVKLSNGDFLIMHSDALKTLSDAIKEFYGFPPDTTCSGQTLLVTFISKISHSGSSIITATNSTNIISPEVCKGSTTSTTFILSLNNDFSDNISTELITTIL